MAYQIRSETAAAGDDDRADAHTSAPVDMLERRGRARPPNQLDELVDNLADWMLEISEEMAEAVMGGVSSPFAEPLSEDEKLRYYTRAMFNADGTPNFVGRDQELQRLGPEGFAQVLSEVLKAHPEWRRQSQAIPTGPLAPDGLPTSNPAEVHQPAQRQSIPMPSGPLAPDGLPTTGVT